MAKTDEIPFHYIIWFLALLTLLIGLARSLQEEGYKPSAAPARFLDVIAPDFPLPKGFENAPVITERMESAHIRQIELQIAGQLPARDIIDFYRETLPSLGWKEEQAAAMETGNSGEYGLSFVKTEGNVRLKLHARPQKDGAQLFIEYHSENE